jgi:endonuclease/exonuclease/phosphatase family metal-dependent hydrolase
MKIQKLLGLIASAVLLVFCFCLSTASAENRNFNIKVMTQNMNPGADPAAIAFTSDLETAISETIASLSDSNIPGRAAIIAAEIARTKPDLVALQEATRWEIATEGGTVVLDQLDQLLAALASAGQHYRVATVHELTAVDFEVITYTDRDAVLVRSDLPLGQLKVLGSSMHNYKELMQLPNVGITVLRGWITVDVKANGSPFKFVVTHLEAPLPDIIPSSTETQVAQADQLLAELRRSNIPVILAGDFNSDAEITHNYLPDVTDSYNHIIAAGFSDAWDVLHPVDAGYTWPLTIDSIHPETPLERIDLVFSNGPQPIAIERIGIDPVNGLYASDHAGVVAEFNLLGRHTNGMGFGRKSKPMKHGHINIFNNVWRKYFHRCF